MLGKHSEMRGETVHREVGGDDGGVLSGIMYNVHASYSNAHVQIM